MARLAIGVLYLFRHLYTIRPLNEVHAIGYSEWTKKAKSGYEITTPTAGVFQDTPAISVRESEEGVSK